MRRLFGIAAWLVCTGALAQAFPVKPVRIVSGPGPDAAARMLAAALGTAWGQQVVTEVLPAASGKLAAETVAKSNADGYTLLNATSSFQIARALGVNSIDVATDLVPVALTNVLPFLLVVPAMPVVNGDTGVQTVAELVARARAAPGKLNYASGGNGTLPHLAAELFRRLTQADIVHVPYKGAEQAVLALMSGQVDMMFTSYPVVRGQVAAGKLRILATTAARRAEALPEVPTLAEVGFSEYELVSWTGLFAPAGTPPAVVAKLRADVAQAVRSDTLRQQYRALGFEMPPDELSGERLAAFLRTDAARWTRLVKESGARVD